MPKSLAEHLGVKDPIIKDAPEPEGPPVKMTAKEFALRVLNSVEYRQSLLRRIQFDELPPAIESLLYHYAYGKPIERLQVEGSIEQPDESIEGLEARAMRLAEEARELRMIRRALEEGRSPEEAINTNAQEGLVH